MSKKPVGECAKLIRGVSYKKQDAIQCAKEGYIPLLRANNILNNQLIWDELIYVPSEYVSDSQYVRAGNIIITMSSGSKAHVGKVALANKDHFAAFGAFCGKLVCEDINPKYLAFALESRTFRQYIESASKGTNINNLKQSHILSYEIEVPKVCEQERIVSKIEELFSKLDASVAELQTAKEKLKVYRQAVLEESLPYDSFGAISQYIESMGQGWSPKCANKNSIDDDVWAVIKTTAVQHGYFDYTENKILPDNLEPRNQHEISVGDILITRAGPRSRCGVCCLVRKTKKRLLNCDKVYQIKPNRDKILPEYMEYVLNSPRFLLEINHCKTGGNDSGVNLTQNRFLTIKIPVPPLNIQKKIVEQIESRLSMCDSIEQTIDTSLQQAEALRQSILKQAFDGELV